MTGAQFAGFAPYVASVSNAGLVAFQAELPGGGTGVFVGDGGDVEELPGRPAVRAVTSHPDVNDAGHVSFYAELADGTQGLVLHRDGSVDVVADRRQGFEAIGPAGPTMNEACAVAFRAERTDRTACVCLYDPASGATTLAEADEVWVGFHGLPVVTEDGTVVFRADLTDGRSGIYASLRGELRAIAETGGRFQALGRFPAVAWDGTVVFAATETTGGDVVVTADGNDLAVVDRQGAFGSFRGALPHGAGRVARLATPAGGLLGLFSGPDPLRDRVVAIGDPLLGSTVTDLAANPVSSSAAGHLAVRVALADGREAVLRFDP
jgi:hypothetical protein